jgi:hypothetical protein
MQVFSDALGLFSRAEPLAYHMLYLESGFSIPVAPGEIDELKVEMRTLEVFQAYLESKAAYRDAVPIATSDRGVDQVFGSRYPEMRIASLLAPPVMARLLPRSHGPRDGDASLDHGSPTFVQNAPRTECETRPPCSHTRQVA